MGVGVGDSLGIGRGMVRVRVRVSVRMRARVRCLVGGEEGGVARATEALDRGGPHTWLGLGVRVRANPNWVDRGGTHT